MGARLLAVELVQGVLEEDTIFESTLADSLTAKKLEPRDQALARAIATTTVRRKGQIDKVLAQLMKNPLGKRAGIAPTLLRVGAAQILFMDVPDHAAVNTILMVAKKDAKAAHFSKLLNGVLRTIGREREEILASLSAYDVIPEWLQQTWKQAYGGKRVAAMAKAIEAEPSVDISVKSDPEGWAERLNGFVLPNGSVRLLGREAIPTLDGFQEGEWWVQDVAASIAANLISQPAGKSVADLCAAPGGKTAFLAAKDAKVTAVDISGGRLKRVSENMKRLQFDPIILEADILQWEPEQKFDAVFLDAPCSATGTVRKHPEALWLKNTKQVERLAKVQYQLLEKAIEITKSGGEIIYCTCSLQPEEGEEIIAKALDKIDDISLSPISVNETFNIDGILTDDGMMRTLPHHIAPPEEFPDQRFGGMDGFFAARLVKK